MKTKFTSGDVEVLLKQSECSVFSEPVYYVQGKKIVEN